MRLASRVAAIDESATLAITSKAKRMAREGLDIISFAAGEPDFDTPDDIKEAAISAIRKGFTKYTPASGIAELKDAVASRMKEDNGLDYAPEQIVISNGAKHSLSNAIFAICESGDEVIIPKPYWLSYPAMVQIAGAGSVFVDTKKENNFKLTGNELEEAISGNTRCLILNSPSNPTGAIYDREELMVIADLAVKHDIYVISDEIYGKLVYGGKKHISIASLGKDIRLRTIVVNGVSKSYAMTGWRIGYAAGPLEVMKAVANLQSHTTSNPSSISQKAALQALTGPQESVEKMRREFEKRRDYMAARIEKMGKISCVKPDGAFYMFCDGSRIGLDSMKLADRLLDEANVAVIPGGPFGAELYFRLSFAADMDTIRQGLDRIESWIGKNG